MNGDGSDHTALLNRAASGDEAAAREVFDAIYGELRRMASARAARGPDPTLQTTALVHEAYLRIVGRNPNGWASVRHFYFTAARAIRDIVVEDARRKGAQKRGAGAEHVELDSIAVDAFARPAGEILALDGALAQLEREDAEGHRLVMLRFFTGLTVPELARVMDLSVSTAERKWRFLRAWLADRLEGEVA